MNQNQLGDNIARYRKEKRLSQKKVAEYLEVSRQAVTKWERNRSKPSSENCIKLAELFGISVDCLFNGKEEPEAPDEKRIVSNRCSWVFCCISFVCLIGYMIASCLLNTLNVGTLICMFVIVVPIQIFLHIYFSNAINNDSFSGIAGYDEKIEYNFCELKKLLVQIDLHIEINSTVYVFLLWVLNCIDLKMEWINSVLLGLYILTFIGDILMNNYQAIDKIYLNQLDQERAKRSLRITIGCLLLSLIGIGIMVAIFKNS